MSAYEMAWRNPMVLTINAGIELKLFSLRRDDNRRPGVDTREACLFDFLLPNDLPAKGYVRDAGWVNYPYTLR